MSDRRVGSFADGWRELRRRLAARRYTGPSQIHWHEGEPRELTVPGPVERIRIDKRRAEADNRATGRIRPTDSGGLME